MKNSFTDDNKQKFKKYNIRLGPQSYAFEVLRRIRRAPAKASVFYYKNLFFYCVWVVVQGGYIIHIVSRDKGPVRVLSADEDKENEFIGARFDEVEDNLRAILRWNRVAERVEAGLEEDKFPQASAKVAPWDTEATKEEIRAIKEIVLAQLAKKNKNIEFLSQELLQQAAVSHIKGRVELLSSKPEFAAYKNRLVKLERAAEILEKNQFSSGGKNYLVKVIVVYDEAREVFKRKGSAGKTALRAVNFIANTSKGLCFVVVLDSSLLDAGIPVLAQGLGHEVLQGTGLSTEERKLSEIYEVLLNEAVPTLDKSNNPVEISDLNNAIVKVEKEAENAEYLKILMGDPKYKKLFGEEEAELKLAPEDAPITLNVEDEPQKIEPIVELIEQKQEEKKETPVDSNVEAKNEPIQENLGPQNCQIKGVTVGDYSGGREIVIKLIYDKNEISIRVITYSYGSNWDKRPEAASFIDDLMQAFAQPNNLQWLAIICTELANPKWQQFGALKNSKNGLMMIFDLPQKLGIAPEVLQKYLPKKEEKPGAKQTKQPDIKETKPAAEKPKDKPKQAPLVDSWEMEITDIRSGEEIVSNVVHRGLVIICNYHPKNEEAKNNNLSFSVRGKKIST